MRKIVMTGALAAMLAVPAGALGHPPTDENQRNAAKHCKALRDASGAGFQAAVDEFTTGKVTAKNAYGKCVAFHARDEHNEEAQSQRAASRDCKELKEQQPELFGPGKQYRNLGQCVSQQRRENKQDADRQDGEFVNAARHCKRERSDAAFFNSEHPDAQGAEGTEDDKTFAQYYGTNENDRNAFGKCVSRHAQEQNDEQEGAQA